ncbi:MAG: thioredoxin domain-containing protein [Alphaproteobacteria bacterium]
MRTVGIFIAIVLIAPAPFGARAADRDAGYQYGGQAFLGEELPPLLRQKLFEIDLETNEQRKQAIDQFIVEKFLAERAALQGLSASQVRQQLLSVPVPSDAEVRAFYENNKQRIGRPFDQSKNDIADYIKGQRELAKTQILLGRIKAEKQYEVILPTPKQPQFEIATEGFPYRGNPEAKVTIVEFADYQCPHCKAAIAVLSRLAKEFGDSIRIVYRDFPVNRSGISREIAKGASCADQQGRFWEYHDLAFEYQDVLATDSPAAFARDLSLDTQAFKQCLDAPQTESRVANSFAEAVALGLSGTPTFFVNGRQLHVHGDLEGPLLDAVKVALQGE